RLDTNRKERGNKETTSCTYSQHPTHNGAGSDCHPLFTIGAPPGVTLGRQVFARPVASKLQRPLLFFLTSSPSCCFPFVLSHPSPSGPHQPRVDPTSPETSKACLPLFAQAGGFESKA
ncbi:hypothetical protein KUCAC02_010077, partial [Chaenocephalus aceratus]